jgi:hypothetical protein
MMPESKTQQGQKRPSEECQDEVMAETDQTLGQAGGTAGANLGGGVGGANREGGDSGANVAGGTGGAIDGGGPYHYGAYCLNNGGNSGAAWRDFVNTGGHGTGFNDLRVLGGLAMLPFNYSAWGLGCDGFARAGNFNIGEVISYDRGMYTDPTYPAAGAPTDFTENNFQLSNDAQNYLGDRWGIATYFFG